MKLAQIYKLNVAGLIGPMSDHAPATDFVNIIKCIRQAQVHIHMYTEWVADRTPKKRKYSQT